MKTLSKNKTHRNRNQRGSFIAELPFTLWILFFLLTFPMLDLATVLLRYTFLVSAARDGVHAAARSKTYLTNTSATEYSAVNAAPTAVKLTASCFSDVQVNSVSTHILVTNITSHIVADYTTPLQQPADTGSNLYELETIVQGQVNPLLNLGTGYFPAIPGLTVPIPATVAAREYCEYPQGLNQ